MANASKQRPKPGSETEARDNPAMRPLKNALRSAMDACPRRYSIAEEAGVHSSNISRFLSFNSELLISTFDKLAPAFGLKLVCRSKAAVDDLPRKPSDVLRWALTHDPRSLSKMAILSGIDRDHLDRFVKGHSRLSLRTADKLFNVLDIEIVRESKEWRPKRKTGISIPPHPNMAELLSAIDRSGLTSYKLARLTGLSVSTISEVRRGHLKLKLVNFMKLAEVVGLKLETTTNVEMLTDQAASITRADPLASPKPRPAWPPGRCPVSFGADGRPVAEQPKKVTGRQLKVIRALHDAGPIGLTGDELQAKSGRSGYRNILATLARDEDWCSRIRLAKGPHGRYRFAMPGEK